MPSDGRRDMAGIVAFSFSRPAAGAASPDHLQMRSRYDHDMGSGYALIGHSYLLHVETNS